MTLPSRRPGVCTIVRVADRVPTHVVTALRISGVTAIPIPGLRVKNVIEAP